MPAYQVSICKITDRTPGLMEYVQKAAALIAQRGGTYIVRGPAETVQEGEALKGVSMIITKWPSLEVCKSFYTSPEYQALKSLREGTGIYDIGVYPELPQ